MYGITIYFLQWEINIWIFCAYKCLCFLYWLGWIVGAVLFHEGKPSYLFYLTTWGAWTIMLYFGMSFAICIHRMATRNSLTDDAEEKFISTTTIEKCETSQDYNISGMIFLFRKCLARIPSFRIEKLLM